MIKKNPTIINVFNIPRKDFSFLVKKSVGDYRVYDTREHYYLERELPYKTGEEDAVKLFTLVLDEIGAKYRMIGKNKVEVFDPEVEEYEDVELPLYQEVKPRNFSYLNCEYFAKNVPTKRMVKAAEEYMAKVEKEIKQAALLGEVRCGIDCGHDNVSTIIETRNEITPELLNADVFYTVILNKPYKCCGSYVTLVIDRDAVVENAKDGVLHLIVPKKWAGIVIGKGGRCTKEMAKALGLKYIDVKAY